MYAELRGQALDKIDLKSRSSTQTSAKFYQNAKFALNVRLHPLTTQQIGFTIGRRDLCTFLVSTPPKLTEPLREEIRRLCAEATDLLAAQLAWLARAVNMNNSTSFVHVLPI